MNLMLNPRRSVLGVAPVCSKYLCPVMIVFIAFVKSGLIELYCANRQHEKQRVFDFMRMPQGTVQ